MSVSALTRALTLVCRYKLWPRVCVSARHKFYQNKSSFLWLTYTHYVTRKFGYLQEQGHFFLWYCSFNWEKFRHDTTVGIIVNWVWLTTIACLSHWAFTFVIGVTAKNRSTPSWIFSYRPNTRPRYSIAIASRGQKKDIWNENFALSISDDHIKCCVVYFCNVSSLRYAVSNLNENKKLSYRRVTARRVLSVVILPITTQQCRNYLYDKSWPNWWYEVGGLVGGNVS